jgi:hypothetical protein
MEEVSRRVFFKKAGAVAAGAAVASTLAAGPLGLASVAGAESHREVPIAPQDDLRVGEHLIARVKNARTGEINLFIGQREVTIHDRKIAARLIRAAR